MKALFEEGAVESFTAECSLLYSSFIYCIMVNRIAWGYSALELSFLLGQDDDFVDNIERFKKFNFSLELYRQLSTVFQHGSFIQNQYHEEEELRHEMHIWKTGETIFYRMECVKSAYESVVLFQLSEENPETRMDNYANSVKLDQQQSQNTLQEMLVDGYFDKPIEAHRLHRNSEHMARRRVDPFHFKTELDKLVGRKGKAPLKRTKRRSYGYRYVLHPGVDAVEAFVFAQQRFEKL